MEALSVAAVKHLPCMECGICFRVSFRTTCLHRPMHGMIKCFAFHQVGLCGKRMLLKSSSKECC